ncbi:MAG: hypothetical protein ACRDTP_00140 [Mycobacteriales bacterium]
MATWDRGSAAGIARMQGKALAQQVSARLARYQPYWRETVRGTGLRAAEIRGLGDLARIPPVGERDLCPDGDPAGGARLVLQPDESGFALHADDREFRRAVRQRLTSPAAYRRTVDDVTRPVAFHLGGLAIRFPIASTRADLDLVARAGARMWQVLGLTSADVLVSAIPSGGTDLAAFALPYAAIGAGAPALHAGPRGAARALTTVPATVLAVRDAAALETLVDACGGRLPPAVTTVLVTGDTAGVARLAPGARVLRVWGAAEARWLWAECAPGSGLHTYPDLEILEVLDPATGERAEAGELTVTQLGTRGSALVRWRTAAVGGLTAGACAHCGRSVPRVSSGTVPAALVTAAEVGGETVSLDLRSVGGALAGRADLAGWTVTVQPHPSGGAPLVVVRVAVADAGRAGDSALGVHADIEAAAGEGPTQVVLDPAVAGRAQVLTG